MRDVAKVQALHMEHVLDRRRVRRVRAREPAHNIQCFLKLGAQSMKLGNVTELLLACAVRTLTPLPCTKQVEVSPSGRKCLAEPAA